MALLAEYFLNLHAGRLHKNIGGFSKEAQAVIQERSWRGNVRELQNVIERAVLLCQTDSISAENLVVEESEEDLDLQTDFPTTTIEEMERRLIFKALNETRGNRTHAARALGISIRTLRNKLKEYKEKNYVADTA